jgi:putative DNA primase/helicase
MANKYDFKGLASELLSRIDSLLNHWLPDGKREGREYVAINPTRSDSKYGSFKVNLSTGRWSDYATGDSGGDLISLYAYLKGLDQKLAYKELFSGSVDEINYTKNKGNTKPKVFQEIVEYKDIPADAPKMHGPKGRKPKAIYSDSETGEELYPETFYRDIDGKILYRVFTQRNKEGRKYPIPTSWCRWKREKEEYDKVKERYVKTGKIVDTIGWHDKDLPENRPLCGMDYVFKRIEAPVLVVEGEKAWAYAIQNLHEYAAVTWRGGSNAVDKTNWSALAGRDIIILPDYDEPGQKAALKIANKLKRQNSSVKICWEALGADLHPSGWDIADESDTEKVRAYIKDNGVGLRSVEALITQEKNTSEDDNDASYAQNDLIGTISGETLNNQRDLRCLGYGGDNKVYFISKKRGVVVSLSPDQLGNINHLLSLMPLNFWYDLFPNKQGGLNKHDCSNSLQRWAEMKGFFNPDVIRGAGVWVEKDGAHVLHMGQKLLVEDDLYDVNDFDSDYMYEATKDLGVRYVKPLGTPQAKKLVDICDWLDWDSPIYGKLLAGFAALAPMCGGLAWRPHIWLTGSAGSGKTTVVSRILNRVCGKMSLFVQGDSSAAGIRQWLGSDALPVVFDEFEGETAKRLDELQKILDLARQASSESGALMLKGSGSGDAVEFKIRSCFAFSAINVNIQHYADASRITVLTLKDPPVNLSDEQKKERVSKFTEFERSLDKILTDEYINALQIRTFKMLPVIKKNARIFGAEVAKKLESARLGDQLGTLCAGAYSLEYSGVVSEDEARNWVNEQDWTLSTPVGEDKDHDKCLKGMLNYVARIQADGHYEEKTIGELVQIVYDGRSQLMEEADACLKRYGLRVDKDSDVLYIANNHIKLAEIMNKAGYFAWDRLLLRCVGAERTPKTVRFTSGSVSKCVAVPLSVVLCDNKSEDEKLAF